MWALLGVGRISALAKKFGCDSYMIKHNSHKLDQNELMRAICKVEQYEMKIKRSIENNVLNSAKYVNSENEILKKMACDELKSWSEIYANLNNSIA